MEGVWDLIADLPQVYKDTDFMTGVVESLQNVVDDSGTVILSPTAACTTNFQAFYGEFPTLWSNINLTQYRSALTDKGAGDGTRAGFTFAQISGVQQITTLFFEFYNTCKFDYYVQSFGVNLQSVTGLSNFGTTLGFKLLDEGDTLFANILTNTAAYALSDTATTREDLGKSFGDLLREILTVEVPSTSIDEEIYYEEGTNFGRRRR